MPGWRARIYRALPRLPVRSSDALYVREPDSARRRGAPVPAGLVTSGTPAETGTPLYAAAALVGSLFIWWSAVQGIRQGDFTADIPVSIATAAAITIGQFSAAAVVAVLLHEV